MPTPEFNLSVRVFGADTLANTIAVVQERANAPFTKTKAAHLIALDFQAHMVQTFKSKGRTGAKWPALTPKYAAYKNRVRPGRSLLVFDGDMIKSLVTSHDSNGIRKQKARSLVLGSKVPYARYHQDGTKNMRARPLFLLTRGVAERWADMVRDQIFQGT